LDGLGKLRQISANNSVLDNWQSDTNFGCHSSASFCKASIAINLQNRTGDQEDIRPITGYLQSCNTSLHPRILHKMKIRPNAPNPEIIAVQYERQIFEPPIEVYPKIGHTVTDEREVVVEVRKISFSANQN
jgi:hypothetical protein